MTFTYDLKPGGRLVISADSSERKALKGLANDQGEFDMNAEFDALESLTANSELHWIRPEEIGALTSAPILGLKDNDDMEAPEADGKIIAAWGYMDYAVRSFVQDLIDTGKAVFVS